MSRIRIFSLRGTVYFYKWLNRFYKALLMTWHQDTGIAVIAIGVLALSCTFVGFAMYEFSCGVAKLMHANTGGIWLLVSAFCLIVAAKVGFSMSETMLPIRKAGEEDEDEQDV